MKISNNALNFLLAQYRAIFKRAYVKGIASAVLLTAGLAAGQAQAAAIYLNGTPNELPTTGQIANITGNSTNPSGAYDPETGDGEFTYLSINSGDALELNGEVIIKSGAAQANASSNRIFGTDEISITGDGKLKIAIDSNGAPETDGLLVISNGETVSVNIGTIDVQNGLLKISDSSTNSGDATVAAGTINIGSADDGTANVTLSASSTDKKVTLGRDATGQSKSIITVSENGTLNLTGTGASGTEVKGQSLTIGANGVMLTDAGTAHKVSTSNLTVEADGFKVVSGNGTKETFAGHTASIAGNLSIGSGAEWVLAATDDTTTETVTEGTTTFESGANVQVGGTLTVSGGTLTVADGAQLVATEASAGSTNAGTIKVTKSGTKSGTLFISSADLKDFLNAEDASGNAITYNEIKEDTGKYIVDKDNTKEAAQGSIFLSEGILEFSGTNRIDLADGYSISGGASNGKSGTITIAAAGGTIKGHDIIISKALSGGIEATHELTVEADTLQIGVGSGATSDQLDSLTEFKVKNFKAHDEVILDANDGKDEFTIDSVLTLDRDYYNKNADGSYNTSSLKGAGTIKGDNLIISGSSSPELKITGGQWTNERQSLTIQSGTLSVAVSQSGSAAGESGSDGIGDDWTYYEGGNPAELTWHGALTFSGSSAGDANLKVTGDSGANAVVDLLDADIKWGSGTVTLSGAVIAAPADDQGNPVQVSPTDYFERAGLGILKLSSTQANDYLGLIDDDEITTATQIKVESGGLLLVEGGLSGNVDVKKFSETASAGVVQLDGGKMFATGSINLVDGVGANGAADTPAKFNINGVLGADSISFNTKVAEKEVGTATDKSTVSGGTLAVASTFSSTNKTVEFLSGSGLLLDSNGFLAEYAPDTADATGSVLVDHLVFNSEDDDSNVAKLDVQTGAWTIGTQDKLGDVDLLAGGTLNVGPGSEEYLRTNVGASLKLDNLYVTNGASSASGTITVDVGGELTVNTLQMEAGSKLTVGDENGIGGVITITGDYAHNITSDNKLDTNAPAGLNTIGNVDKIKDFAGINLNGADVTLHSAKFVLGDAAARALVNLDRDAKSGSQATIDDGLKANFTLEGTSELRLDFTAAEGEDPTNGLKGVNGDKKLTANQAKELKEALLGSAANVANTTKFDVGSY